MPLNINVGTAPEGVAITPDGAYVYVCNFTSNTVSVISTSTNTVIKTIGVGTHPFDININSAGTFAYVTNSSSNTVSVIKISTNTVIHTIAVGSQPRGIALDAAGTFGYTANTTSKTISKINLSTNSVIASYSTSVAPVDITVSGSIGWVALTNGTVKEINLNGGATIATISLGATPLHILRNSHNGKIYVTSTTSNQLLVITAASVSATISLTNPQNLDIDPSGNYVYVARASGVVSILDVASNTLLPYTYSAHTSPQAVVSKSINGGVALYVSNASSNDVSYIQAVTPVVAITEYAISTDSVTATVNPIPIGSNPLTITMDPTGTQAYVANGSGSLASVFNLTSNTNANTDFPAHMTGSAQFAFSQSTGKFFLVGGSSISIYAPGWTGIGLYGYNFVGIVSNSTGSGLYVTVSNQTDIVKIHASSNTLSLISTPSSHQAICTNNGATFAYATRTSTGVTIIDLSTDLVTGLLPTGNNPIGIAINPTNAYAYVVNSADNTVSVISLSSQTIMSTIPVGNAPYGIAINPQGTYACVSNSLDNTVSIINLVTNTIEGDPIPVGSSPKGVMINSDGSFGYCCNNGENSISVFSINTGTLIATIEIEEFVNSEEDWSFVSPIDGGIDDLTIGLEALPFGHMVGKTGTNPFDLSYAPQALPELASTTSEVPISLVALVSSTEYVISTDLVETRDFAPTGAPETGDVLDLATFIINLSITETIHSTESVLVNDITPVIDYSGIRIAIGTYKAEDNGVRIAIGEYRSDNSGIDIEIDDNNISPVTDLFSLVNPYEPTVYIGGTSIVTNPSTDPGGTQVQNTDVYIHWLSTGVDGNDWTELYNFNFTLNYYDGSFSIVSKRPPNVSSINYATPYVNIANTYINPTVTYGSIAQTPIDPVAQAHLGKQVDVFGFTGTIIDFGAGISDSQAAYISSGTFGNPLMHRQLNLLMPASGLQSMLASNQTLNPLTGVPAGDSASMAKSLANITHSTLIWGIQNVPLQNNFKIDGLTAQQAISSLASIAGGVLRWDGNSKYVIAYPDQYYGVFTIPDAKLLTSAGASYSFHYDLETGLSGTGMVLFPVLGSSNKFAALANPAKSNGSLPALQRVGKVAKVLTTDDPPEIFDLPYNYDKVYIQTLIGEGGDTSGQIPASVRNFMTKDPEEWFEFNISKLSLGNDSYVFNAYLGDQYIPQVKVDANLFTPSGTNTSIDNNNFVMNLACSTKDLAQLFDNAKNNMNETISSAINPVKFIKTYSGSITFQFYGAIPLPGEWASVTIPGGATCISYNNSGIPTIDTIPVNGGDFVVQGIIEEVQFTFPGLVTLSLAQYLRVNYLENYLPAISTISH